MSSTAAPTTTTSAAEPCADELKQANVCVQVDPSKCVSCFNPSTFEQDLKTSITGQFMSTMAFYSPTDPKFCASANQRVCSNYQMSLSCCCAKETAAYRQCLFNTVLVPQVGMSSTPPCKDTCVEQSTASSNSGANGGLIGGMVVLVIFLLSLIGGYIVYRRKRNGSETLPHTCRDLRMKKLGQYLTAFVANKIRPLNRQSPPINDNTHKQAESDDDDLEHCNDDESLQTSSWVSSPLHQNDKNDGEKAREGPKPALANIFFGTRQPQLKSARNQPVDCDDTRGSVSVTDDSKISNDNDDSNEFDEESEGSESVSVESVSRCISDNNSGSIISESDESDEFSDESTSLPEEDAVVTNQECMTVNSLKEKRRSIERWNSEQKQRSQSSCSVEDDDDDDDESGQDSSTLSISSHSSSEQSPCTTLESTSLRELTTISSHKIQKRAMPSSHSRKSHSDSSKRRNREPNETTDPSVSRVSNPHRIDIREQDYSPAKPGSVEGQTSLKSQRPGIGKQTPLEAQPSRKGDGRVNRSKNKTRIMELKEKIHYAEKIHQQTMLNQSKSARNIREATTSRLESSLLLRGTSERHLPKRQSSKLNTMTANARREHRPTSDKVSEMMEDFDRCWVSQKSFTPTT